MAQTLAATKLNRRPRQRPHLLAETPPVNPSANSVSDPPVYDASVLEAMFGNDPQVIASVLETFVNSTRANLADLDLAVEAHDLASMAASAHKMVGACQMSGAKAMGHTACALEQAAKRNDMAALLHAKCSLHTQWILLQTTITHRSHTTGR